MKVNILKQVLIILLVFTLTSTNFLFVGASAFSYAVDIYNSEIETNNKNVTFDVYFKDENGNKITNKETAINSQNVKMFIDVAVQEEGYFNGIVEVKNSNFEIKSSSKNKYINKIENNKITLNQINASEIAELELEVEPTKTEQINSDFLSQTSEIQIKGIYKDSTEEDINIDTTRQLQLTYTNPYTDNEGAELETKIITNKVYNISGENKRIVQVLVKSGLKNNAYPIKETNIELNAPMGTENVEVLSRGTIATNGKEETLTQENWEYSERENKIKINIKNNEENGKITWNREGNDEIVVTYIIDKDIDITNKEITAKTSIKLYDVNETIKEQVSTQVLAQEIDGLITSEITVLENSMYKGKIYSGEGRNYTTIAKIHINNTEVIDYVSSEISMATYSIENAEIDANSQYITTKINKQKLEYILGENGVLSIFNIDGNALAQITKDSQPNQNGDIVINYPEGVKGIYIQTTKPENVGTITLNNTKTLKQTNYDRQIIAMVTTLNEKMLDSVAQIELQNTETSAKLELNKNTLSTMVENKDVEIKATLLTNGEQYDLYENPIVRIELPTQVQSINVNYVRLLYGEGLNIQSANIHDENGYKVIEVILNGKQIAHSQMAVEGATLIINANIILDKRATSNQEKIRMVYTNQTSGIQNTIENAVDIVSPKGLITINTIEDYGMSVVGEQDAQVAKLELGVESKQNTVNIEVINNNKDTISNVKIMGTFPTQNSKNNIVTSVTPISGNGNIYYTENENATDDLSDSNNLWGTQLVDATKVKKYLIVADSLEPAQSIVGSYQVTIPEGLGYNQTAYESYSVTYDNVVQNTTDTLNSTELGISTGKGPELTSALQATIGGKNVEQGAEVANGEVIKYVTTIENTGTEDATNVVVKGLVPEGTTYVEGGTVYSEVYYTEFPDKKEVEKNVERIAVGEKVQVEYEVRVNTDTLVGTELNNKITTVFGEANIESETVTNIVKKGELRVTTVRGSDLKTEITNNSYMDYLIDIDNISEETKNNVEITIVLPEELELVSARDESTGEVIEEKNGKIRIGNIEAGKTRSFTVIVRATNVIADNNISIKEVSIYSTVKADNAEECRSNAVKDTVKYYKLNIDLTSTNANGYVKSDDIIEYIITVKNDTDVAAQDITIEDEIPTELDVKSVEVNGEIVETSGNNIHIVRKIDANSKLIIKITAVVNYKTRTEPVVIDNIATANDKGEILSSQEISHILQPEAEGIVDGNSANMISGLAWVDKNEDGERQATEDLLEGVTVRLLDANTGTIATNMGGVECTTTTNQKGFYMFTEVPQGQYLVVFEYNTNLYTVTTYQKEGVLPAVNSDAVTQTISINGVQDKYGVTDVITMTNEGIPNIDIGLITSTLFDMELNKYVSKIIVQTNNGTKTYEYGDSKLAKVEIRAKELQGATVIIEYKIKITNKGEVAGYVRNIADYMPAQLQFNSELNTDWYQQGTDLYNSSLANTPIQPGETKELSLTLTKSMTEESTGLVNNTAEIAECYNEPGLEDINSIPGNRAQGENDMDSADVIISVSTGAMITYIGLTISVLVLIAIGAYLIQRKLFTDKRLGL